MSTVNAVLNEARKHLGYYRRPGTPTTFGEWYARQVKSDVYRTAQWCAMYVSYVAAQAGASKIIPLHAYTPSGVNWFKSKGRWHNGLGGVRPGDIVYFNFGSLGRVSHVGIVESVNSDGSVNTLEGNTSSSAGGDQRNSGTCARKRRKAYAVGYGRPAYTAGAATGGVEKSVSTLADEVLAGKHGSGDQRKRSLGSQYAAVQAEVNRRAKGGSSKSISVLADEVLAGKHGTAVARKKSLGSQYAAVQAEVNRRLKGGKTPAKPASTVPGWFHVVNVGSATLSGRSGPSTRHKIKHKRKKNFNLYIAKTVKGGGYTWGVTNYGTYYAMNYLKSGKY